MFVIFCWFPIHIKYQFGKQSMSISLDLTHWWINKSKEIQFDCRRKYDECRINAEKYVANATIQIPFAEMYCDYLYKWEQSYMGHERHLPATHMLTVNATQLNNIIESYTKPFELILICLFFWKKSFVINGNRYVFPKFQIFVLHIQ